MTLAVGGPRPRRIRVDDAVAFRGQGELLRGQFGFALGSGRLLDEDMSALWFGNGPPLDILGRGHASLAARLTWDLAGSDGLGEIARSHLLDEHGRPDAALRRRREPRCLHL